MIDDPEVEELAALPDLDGLLGGSGRTVRTLEFSCAAEVDPAVVVTFLDLAVELGAARRSGGRAAPSYRLTTAGPSSGPRPGART